jgi:pimeloyl-ACP methyl ester carboxylesterase
MNVIMDRRTATRILAGASIWAPHAFLAACRGTDSPPPSTRNDGATRASPQTATPTMDSLPLPDGRTIEFLLGGDPAGVPLLLHHGTPSDMTVYSDWHELCRDRGVRLISASRAGYGESSRKAGRSVADAAPDAAALLDHLGHTSFVTAGWSGGGPHALACAALLPGRCVATATLAGVGAYGANDLDFLAGMGPENVAEFGAALKGEAALRQWLHDNAESYRSVTGAEIAAAFGGLVPDVDKQVLTGAFADHTAAEMRRALANGFDGWVDDDLAFVRPWGFTLEEMTVPVTVWQGELDLMVPVAHGRWLLGRIPGATSRILPAQGHLSVVVNFRSDLVDDLVARARR